MNNESYIIILEHKVKNMEKIINNQAKIINDQNKIIEEYRGEVLPYIPARLKPWLCIIGFLALIGLLPY